jgi:hypothetical protein
VPAELEFRCGGYRHQQFPKKSYRISHIGERPVKTE